MSELLFEGYGIPAVSYGVDSLFSFYRNDIGDTALIINCGYHTIHIIPVIKGKVFEEHARRINLGKFFPCYITFYHYTTANKCTVRLTVRRYHSLLTRPITGA